MLRMAFVADLVCELGDEFALTATHLPRDLDHDGHELIALTVPAVHRDPLATQAEDLPRLGPWWHFHHHLSFECRDIDARAEHRLGKRNRDRHQDVRLLALEECVVADTNVNVEIAVNSVGGLACASDGSHGAVLDTCWDLHAHSFGTELGAGPFACFARRRNLRASAAAPVAWTRCREEPALILHLATPLANVARVHRGPGVRAAPAARDAWSRSIDIDFLFDAERCLYERDLEIVLQVATTSALAATPAEDLAEEPFEDLADGAEVGCVEARAIGVERGVSVPVIADALVGVAKNGVGFACLFERVFSGGVVRIAVRVISHRERTIGLFDLLAGGGAADFEDQVVIAFAHGFRSVDATPDGANGMEKPSGMWEGKEVPAFELEVEEDDSGERLDVLLARRAPGLSRGRVKRLFEAGEVRLNGRRAKKSALVATGDRVTLESLPGPTDFHATPDPALDIEVVVEREGYVVVEKPAGVPSHPLREGELGTLAGALVVRYPEMRGVGYRKREPGILHRLDNDTSGLMLAARDQPTFEALRQQLQAGEIEKRYVARCAGIVIAPQIVDAPIANDPRDRRKVRVCRDPREIKRLQAQPARTEILRSERDDLGSRVEVRANNARRHQVRVHLASIGHPLLGDTLYGGPILHGLDRHLLHASYLAFTDPKTGTRSTTRSP